MLRKVPSEWVVHHKTSLDVLKNWGSEGREGGRSSLASQIISKQYPSSCFSFILRYGSEKECPRKLFPSLRIRIFASQGTVNRPNRGTQSSVGVEFQPHKEFYAKQSQNLKNWVDQIQITSLAWFLVGQINAYNTYPCAKGKYAST